MSTVYGKNPLNEISFVVSLRFGRILLVFFFFVLSFWLIVHWFIKKSKWVRGLPTTTKNNQWVHHIKFKAVTDDSSRNIFDILRRPKRIYIDCSSFGHNLILRLFALISKEFKRPKTTVKIAFYTTKRKKKLPDSHTLTHANTYATLFLCQFFTPFFLLVQITIFFLWFVLVHQWESALPHYATTRNEIIAT